MKKVLFRSAFLLVALTVVFMLVVPPAEKAQAAPDVSQACSDPAFLDFLFDEFGLQFDPDTGHGDCVSLVQAAINAANPGAGTDAVAICKALFNQNGIAPNVVPFGQCVSFFIGEGC